MVLKVPQLPKWSFKIPKFELELPDFRDRRGRNQRRRKKFKWSDLDPRRLTKRRMKVLSVKGYRFAKHELIASARFLKACYVDGTKAIVAGKYTRGQAAVIIFGMIPVLLCVALMTIPSVLFPTPDHNSYYMFAKILANQGTSALPIILGVISTTLSLKVPVG